MTLVSPLIALAQKASPLKATSKETTRLLGRVLAWRVIEESGAGLGPEYQVFLFGVEGYKGSSITPVKITYAFFRSDGSLHDSFFDYSKRYELQGVRYAKCDESVQSFSYAKNVDESGKPLPPINILRFVDGAPRDALKPDATLACYILRPGRYKTLSQDSEHKSGGEPAKNNAAGTPMMH